MGARDCLVRRVRLAADSEETLRHMLPRLEDALRCESLPDDAGRVLVVRKLALGRIPHDCSAQQLSRLIEHRVADLGAEWHDGDSADAKAADFVRFRSALDARVALMRRLVRGQSCSAWYWPLAVKEFRSGETLRENLRNMAAEIAQWPEAAAALPAWVAGVARAGALEQLAESFGADDGAALVQRAGIAIRRSLSPDPADAGTAEFSQQDRRAESTKRAVQGIEKAHWPRWLASLLHAAGLGTKAGGLQSTLESTQTSTQNSSSHARSADQGAAAAVPASFGRSVQHGPAPPRKSHPSISDGPPAFHTKQDADNTNAPSPAADRIQPTRDDQSIVSGRASFARATATDDVSGIELPADAGHVVDRQAAQVWLAPTQCGGLLFLLPVLQGLGLPRWCNDDQAGAAIARRILAAAMMRLRAPGEDTAWGITRSQVDLPTVTADAPAIWSDTVLRAPASHRQVELRQALTLASTVDQQAQVWLTAVRRWLRRRGGIGLASLVLRPARLSHTATHLDMHFYVNDVDMRVRRLGLDIDPGWLPWFGRIVSYHYQERSA